MTEQVKILMVDDLRENHLVMESVLSYMGLDIIKAMSGEEALTLCLQHDFAVIFMDVQMPGMDGFETAELLRGIEKTKNIPIIFVTAICKEQNSIFKGYEVGAVDYLFKPIDPIVLQSKAKVFIELYNQKRILKDQTELLELKIKELVELRETNIKLESLSTLDGLTGIPNRRHFNEYLDKCWRNCSRSGSPLSLIIADIDYFKAYNDNYGHLQGDDCLISVARCIDNSVKRPMDLAARYGGEEFGIILPETEIEGAMIVAEEIRRNIEALDLEHKYSKAASRITISLGAAAIIPNAAASISELIGNADKALYMSKTNGRNKVSKITLNEDQNLVLL